MSGYVTLSEWQALIRRGAMHLVGTRGVIVRPRPNDLAIEAGPHAALIELRNEMRPGEIYMVPGVRYSLQGASITEAAEMDAHLMAIDRVRNAVSIVRLDHNWPERVYQDGHCPCGSCGGSGKVYNDPCRRCGGEGVR